jgi:hypothetical protein
MHLPLFLKAQVSIIFSQFVHSPLNKKADTSTPGLPDKQAQQVSKSLPQGSIFEDTNCKKS